MKQFVGVWETPFFTFELGIGKSIRLLKDSKDFEYLKLFKQLNEEQYQNDDLNITDPSLNAFIFGMVYREQALVLCVSSFEVYFKRKLPEICEEISEPKRKSMKKLNFQNLDCCKEFIDILKLSSFEDRMESLKEPFQDRHIITHNGSVIDNKWTKQLNKPKLLAEINQKQLLTYDYVRQTILDCHKIISDIESEINQKYNIEKTNLSLIGELLKNI